MKRPFHREKHREKKRLIGNDQLNRQEKMDALKVPYESTGNKLEGEAIAPSLNEKRLASEANAPLMAAKVENPTRLEKVLRRFQKTAEQARQFFKHLF